MPKRVEWLVDTWQSPPMGARARVAAGVLLKKVEHGIMVTMPHSRPMPSIGPRVHEFRVSDENRTWRIIYRIDSEAIVLVDWFEKKTQTTPQHVMEACRAKLKRYDTTDATS
jgi:phage-related protein